MISESGPRCSRRRRSSRRSSGSPRRPAKERPNLLQTALTPYECRDYFVVTSPPPVLQRVMFPVLAGIARKQQTVATIRSHVKRIRDITGSYDHFAIGLDLDGFIKPMLRGLEHSGRPSALQDALRAEYGEETAEKICSGNVLRLLQRHWGARPGLASAAETEAIAAEPPDDVILASGARMRHAARWWPRPTT